MAVTLDWGDPGYDIFVNIFQSNNYSSYHLDPALDVGHARIFQMVDNGAAAGAISVVTGEPLSYPGGPHGAGGVPEGPPIGHILAFCRDYYLPNRLQAKRDILIIPCALGGTGFSGTRANSWIPKYADNGLGGGLFERCITRVNAAMAAAPGGVIKACFCQGGEADSFWVSPNDVNGNPTTYYTDLEAASGGQGGGVLASVKDFNAAMVSTFRARWTNGTNVPFLFGQMSQNYKLAPPNGVGYLPASGLAMEQVASYISNCVSIATTGLTTNNLKLDNSADIYGSSYWVHYDAISQRGGTERGRTETNPLSKRYWEGYQTLASPAGGWTWRSLGPGAGGWVTRMEMHSDGTFIARTDTNGAYIFNSTTGLWEQMIRQSRLPAQLQSTEANFLSFPCYEVRMAPSNSSIMYMSYCYGYTLKSINKGLSWTLLTGLARNGALNGNDNSRNYGPKMAIDPLDANVVYLSNRQLGIAYTFDGGTTWAAASGVPGCGTDNQDIYIAVDPSSTTVNGRKSRVYAHVYGVGLYKTENAGSATPTWAAVAGAPTTTHSLEISPDGTLYVVDDVDWSIFKRYRAGTWAALVPEAGAGFIAVHAHPTDSNKFVCQSGKTLWYTTNATATTPTWVKSPSATLTSTDIPWLTVAAHGDLNCGKGCWDTLVANRLWSGDGVGIWRCDALPPTASAWTSVSKGIEQMCTFQILCPGANPLLLNMDRPVFRITTPGTYPSTYGPDDKDMIQYGYSCDWASSNPNFIGLGASSNVGGKPFRDPTGRYTGESFAFSSTDEGVTWAIKGKIPSRTEAQNPDSQGNPGGPGIGWGGGMAIATPSNWIIAQMHSGGLIGTTDGGLTWTQVNLTALGIPLALVDGSVDAGWGGNNLSFPRRRVACADRVNHTGGGTFYVWNSGPAANASAAGVYRTKNGPFGTWEKISDGNAYLWSFFSAGMKSVPGKAGHLFHFVGAQGNPEDPPNPSGGGGNLYYTRAAYTATTASKFTWTVVTTEIQEIADVGFGAPASGKDYPTIYVTGLDRGGTWGVFMASATDAQWAANTVTWQRIGSIADIDPWSGQLATISGNMSRYGEVYGGGGGNGYVWAALS